MNNITWIEVTNATTDSKTKAFTGIDEHGNKYLVLGAPEKVTAVCGEGPNAHNPGENKFRSFKSAKEYCAGHGFEACASQPRDPRLGIGTPIAEAMKAQIEKQRLEIAKKTSKTDEKRDDYVADLSNGETVHFKSASDAAAKYRAYRIAHDLSKKSGHTINLVCYGMISGYTSPTEEASE